MKLLNILACTIFFYFKRAVFALKSVFSLNFSLKIKGLLNLPIKVKSRRPSVIYLMSW